ncbi:carbohydrate ABC transporter permease [Quadrisphaera sp. DSM 44207]|uniref:carbohydrate ABC transporter permease n=1 Tax=Quadrisphaera sp. DSM 44207 TaxID=1881057 RepID=UPI00088EF8FB|nr:sugar ABC transporter permease [Quadrisphaera sp. DSM 44207]SDQ36726.1 carbohydrate ABC transporter membrane protein 1, CUT1 family [Quadrisphaera sp. DSM 44207]
MSAVGAPATTGAAAPGAIVSGRAPRAAARRRGRHGLSGGRGGFWFVLPFLLVYAAFTLWPLVHGLGMSFFDTSLISDDSSFVGLANYARLFDDPQVWRTLGTTLLFTLLSTVPLVLVALVMALLVHTGTRGQWFWRFAYFAPFLLPVATVVLIWQWLFQGDFGLLNAALGWVGLDPVGWTTDPDVALWSTVLLTVWWTVGFNFLLYLAALQAIPATVYEAAAIDGAGGWRRLFSITLPLLGVTTGLVVTLQVLASLKLFDQAYILYAGSGGPGGAAAPILQHVYDTGFVNYRLGYASAISYVFFVLVLAIALVQARIAARRSS